MCYLYCGVGIVRYFERNYGLNIECARLQAAQRIIQHIHFHLNVSCCRFVWLINFVFFVSFTFFFTALEWSVNNNNIIEHFKLENSSNRRKIMDKWTERQTKAKSKNTVKLVQLVLICECLDRRYWWRKYIAYSCMLFNQCNITTISALFEITFESILCHRFKKQIKNRIIFHLCGNIYLNINNEHSNEEAI